MSGGVDSSVTAALLAHQHKFDLEGVFMRNWDVDDDDTRPGGGCQWEKDWVDVQRVCRALGIKARMVRVLSRFFDETMMME
jgi:tRNA-specific 2-thiouridylase